MQKQDKPAGLVRAVAGIDAAITARHHIGGREFFCGGLWSAGPVPSLTATGTGGACCR